MARQFHYPPELALAICACIYASGLPAAGPSLDPPARSKESSFPSSISSCGWSEPVTRTTLANLCLVNHAWYAAAKPWLWRKVEVRLPRCWLSIVEEVAGDVADEARVEKTTLALEVSIKEAAEAALSSTPTTARVPPQKKLSCIDLKECILEEFNGPYSSIPVELLSPPPSRDPSPVRERVEVSNHTRWQIMRAIRNAVINVVQSHEPYLYVPTPHDPHPGRYVRHLDFNHFRTIGMRHSVEDGVTSLVTGDRIEAALKEMTNLTAFGATEYIDSALTLPVLKELFLRGTPSQRRNRLTYPRELPSLGDSDDIERRQECKELEAIDFTGCVSAVFVNALTEFVTAHLLATPPGSKQSEDRARKRRRAHLPRIVTTEEPLTFPGLQRLGLRGVKSIAPQILMPFILSFPSLTHLDLSGTRATPELLASLGGSPTVRLHSLSLARCVLLTGAAITNFLVESPVASCIQELSLYGDMTYPCPLSQENLHEIVKRAPCFTRGDLQYLDLSSAPITKDLLVNAFKPQPKLRSLGLSYIVDLELNGIVQFLSNKARNVEVLTLISTSPELDCGFRTAAIPGMPRGPTRQASLALHAQLIAPLCEPPFSPRGISSPPPTRLRVIELSTPLLGGLGVGSPSWRVLRSKGGRGWYVDTASAWVSDGKEGSFLSRDLDKSHPRRVELDRLADANGNVSSGTGWHARKMEILHGHGMLGREDGLYGAVSFAHQG